MALLRSRPKAAKRFSETRGGQVGLDLLKGQQVGIGSATPIIILKQEGSPGHSSQNRILRDSLLWTSALTLIINP